MWAKRRGQKFGATRTNHAGRSFASKLEATLFDHLTLLERAGEIRDLKCQTQVKLSAAQIIYKPDFQFVDVKTGETVWAESKGFETPEWRLKRRLWIAYGPGLLQVYRGNSRGVFLHEELRSQQTNANGLPRSKRCENGCECACAENIQPGANVSG